MQPYEGAVFEVANIGEFDGWASAGVWLPKCVTISFRN